MKTPKYNPGTKKLIWLITILFGLQINLFSSVSTFDSNPLNHFSVCLTCKNNTPAVQQDESFTELTLLAPTTPTEAPFSDEVESIEINLIPTAPSEASFEDDPELISPGILEYLAPTAPATADFGD